MEKHNKFKKTKHSNSLDGIVSDGRRLGTPVNRSYQPNRDRQTPVIGSVAAVKDGFYPMRQSAYSLGANPEASETEALLSDEPIVLDDTLDDVPKKKVKHRVKKPKSGKRLALKRFLFLLAGVIILSGLYFGYKFYQTQRDLFHGGGASAGLYGCKDIDQLKKEGDCRINILLLGIGGQGHAGGDLTDTILILSIDPINNTASMLSIPRDTWVNIAGDGSQKINAAYAYGKEGSLSKSTTAQKRDGLKKLDATLAPILDGVHIHYHAMVDFKAFKQAVDSVGGVTFNVPKTLYDPTIAWENHYDPYIARKGVNTFNGEKALLYAKSRETSSDFDRSERQRLVLVALKDKTFSAGTLTNPAKVSSLLSSFGHNIYTDFKLSEILKLKTIMQQIPSDQIKSLDLVKPPNDFLTTANINGLSVVQPKAGLFEYAEIQNFIRSAFRDGYLAKENANVAVYNATSMAGLGAQKAKLLKTLGYNVTTVQNTHLGDSTKTILVDLSKGKNRYTRHYLELRYGQQARTNLPPGSNIQTPVDTDFVIILGTDAQ